MIPRWALVTAGVLVLCLTPTNAEIILLTDADIEFGDFVIAVVFLVVFECLLVGWLVFTVGLVWGLISPLSTMPENLMRLGFPIMLWFLLPRSILRAFWNARRPP